MIAFCLAFACPATPAAAEPAPGQAGWLYDPGKVVTIDLTLSPAAEAALEDEPDEYVEGGFAISTTDGVPGGEEHLVESRDPVGIRLKGSAKGSFRSLSGKAAFKVKFKEFGGSKFEGLKKMTLNNMVEDFSLIHETLAYTAYRGAGLPASRTGYAFVRVNGHPYGLYLDIEDMDDVALERWFGKFADPQHLYEGESGADVVPGVDALPPDEGGFEVDEGNGASLDDLKALVAAVNSTEGEGWSDAVSPVADLPELTRIWAVEKYIGHWDGYAGEEGKFQPNNYFLYSDSAGVFQMLPWGADETFERRLAFDGPAGLMFDRCLADPACLALYRQQLGEVSKAIKSLDLEALATETAAFIEPWWEADPRLEQPDHVEDATSEALSFLLERQEEVGDWLGPKEAAPQGNAGPAVSGQSAGSPEATDASAEPPAVKVHWIHVDDGALTTHLSVSREGLVRQTATIRTANGTINACSTQASVAGAGVVTLSCPLSKRVRQRARARWLRLAVQVRFAPRDGLAESLTRQVVLPRG